MLTIASAEYVEKLGLTNCKIRDGSDALKLRLRSIELNPYRTTPRNRETTPDPVSKTLRSPQALFVLAFALLFVGTGIFDKRCMKICPWMLL
jgi:hypothetical protein